MLLHHDMSKNNLMDTVSFMERNGNSVWKEDISFRGTEAYNNYWDKIERSSAGEMRKFVPLDTLITHPLRRSPYKKESRKKKKRRILMDEFISISNIKRWG